MIHRRGAETQRKTLFFAAKSAKDVPERSDKCPWGAKGLKNKKSFSSRYLRSSRTDFSFSLRLRASAVLFSRHKKTGMA